jgi:hypothetical protein
MTTIPNKQTETIAPPAPTANTKQTDVLISLLSQANQLTLSEGFETSSSWKRAQQSTDIIGSRNAGQWQISLPRLDGTLGGDYCVTFCLQSDECEHEHKHEQGDESRMSLGFSQIAPVKHTNFEISVVTSSIFGGDSANTISLSMILRQENIINLLLRVST